MTPEPLGMPSSTTQQSSPPPGFWERVRRTKLLQPLTDCPDEARRVVEIDLIVASPEAWAACQERLEEGWDVTRLGALLLVERTMG